MAKYNVFIIHGIGKQSDGYSDELTRHIEKEVGKNKVNFVEIVYADILSEKIKSYTLNELSLKNIDSPDLRTIFNETVYDAISYGYKRARILKKIADVVSANSEDGDKNSFIAHSLGGLVLYDFLSKSNIEAFNIFTLGTPLALRLIEQKALVRAKFWINIVGSSDIIAKPLKTDFLNISECDLDYIAPIGSFIQRRTPLSHVAYWTDDNVIKPIAKKISMDLKDNFSKSKYLDYLKKLWLV